MEIIGLDLHKRASQLSIKADDGTITDRRIATSRERFTAVLGGRAPARILLEASTESEWVARHLESLGHAVIVADPNYAPMYANRSRRTKTDKRDARTLMDACETGARRPAYRQSEARRHVRAGAVGVAISQNGTLAYHEGEAGLSRRVLWTVGVDGTERRVPAAEQNYFVPRVSPDGQRAVVENNAEDLSGPSGPISLLDLRTGAVQRLAAPGEGQSPAWTRDGRRVAFLRFLGPRGREIVSRAWDRSGEDEILLRDASALLFDFRLGVAGGQSVQRSGGVGSETAGQRILVAPTDSLSQARPLMVTTAREVTPDLSPDGRWLAYASDESGRREIYVQPVPGPGARLQVSVTGGQEPIWSPQRGTLFYRSPERLIIAARLEMAPLRVVQWDTLFVDRFQRGLSRTNWSVFPNGKEFLMISTSQSTSGVKALVNWPQLPEVQRTGSTPP